MSDEPDGLKEILGDIKLHTKTRRRRTVRDVADELVDAEERRKIDEIKRRYYAEVGGDSLPTRPPRPEPIEITDGWDNIFQEGGNPVTTLKETAVLSMDPQKAAIVLRCSYNPEFIESMKQKVPSSQRRWDPADKLWIFHPDAMTTLKELLAIYYGGVRVVGIQRQIPATRFDQLLARLTLKDKQAIYVLLAKRYHPDVGGDRETMTLINDVFKG